MTQTLKRSASWRGLRRKVVGTASVAALVVGGAVAVAPAASAANNNSLTASVNDWDADNSEAGDGEFPDLTVTNAATSGAITVKNPSGKILEPGTTKDSNGDPVANEFAVQVKAQGSGLVDKYANSALTELSLDLNTAGVSGNAFDLASGATASGSTLTQRQGIGASLDSDSDGNIDAGKTLVDGKQFDLTVDGWTGNLTVTVSIIEVPGSGSTQDADTVLRTLATTNFSTKVADQKDPTLVDNDKAPAVKVGHDYSFDSVKDAGVNDPAATFTLSSAAGHAEAVATLGTADDDGNVKVTTAAGNEFTFNENTGTLTADADDTGNLNYYSDDADYATYTVTESVASATTTFALPVLFVDSDSINSNFTDSVYWAASTDPAITEGDKDGNFMPTANVTRAQFAAFLYRAQGNEADTCSSYENSGFSDVDNDSPLCTAIRGLAEDGVINGTTDTTFDPGAPITRAQEAVLLYRAHALNVFGDAGHVNSADECSSDPFNDVAEDFWACAQINWASNEDITTGTEDGNFLPGQNTTRQVAVTFLERAQGLI